MDTSLFVFDMSTLSWRDGFDPDEAAYVFQKPIINVI